MRTYSIVLGAVLGFFLWPVMLGVEANANMLGSTVSWQYYAYGGAYTEGQSSGTFVVNGGVGGTFSVLPDYVYFNILADATSITFDYSVATPNTGPFWDASPLSLAPTIHNGIAINMISGRAFTAVTINPATNMVGFDANRISFTGTQIQIDWEKLPFDTSTIVKLDIVTIPAPLGLGLFGLAVMALRRRRCGLPSAGS